MAEPQVAGIPPNERIFANARHALKTMPKYDQAFGGFRQWSDSWQLWYTLNAINTTVAIDQGVFAKQCLLFAMTGAARDMVEPIKIGTPTFNDTTVEQFHQHLETIFEPAAEQEMARQRFRDVKQRRDEDISTYISRKLALYNRAYPVAERSVQIYREHAINGMFANVVKRDMMRANSQTYNEVRDDAIRIVAMHRNCYKFGYGEATDLGGLAATTKVAQNNIEGEAMDIDNLEEVKSFGEQRFKSAGGGQGRSNKETRKCYNCNTIGHLSAKCTAPRRPRPNANKKTNPGVKCNFCKIPGHTEPECRKKKKQLAAKRNQSVRNLDDDTPRTEEEDFLGAAGLQED